MPLAASGRAWLKPSGKAALPAGAPASASDSASGQQGSSGEAQQLAQREADFCLGYGLYWLENGEGASFCWSRRFFGFYLDLDQIREFELEFESAQETTLTFYSDRTEVAAVNLGPGRQSATFRVPAESRKYRIWHAGFRVGDTWQPASDPRRLGIKWYGMRVRTGSEIIHYSASVYSQNGAKTDWLRLDDYFRLHGNTAHDLRRNARLNVKERRAETQEVVSTPLRLYMELAWLCNIRCPSCFQAYVPNNLRKEATHFMSPHVFREAAEKLFPGAAMVWYSGNGETLLHPNIDTILRTALDFKFVPALLTNGTLFTEHNMRLLVEGGFFLSISIDSPYEKDFERLRAGARFSKLVGALEYFRTLQRQIKNKRFHIRIQCVAQQSNLDQVVDLVKWGASYGAREIQFLPIHNFGHHSEYIEQAMLYHTPERVNSRMLEAVRTGTKLGVRVRPVPPLNPGPALTREFQAAADENIYATRRLDDLYDLALNMPEHPANNPDGRCSLAWSECFICADGKVAPCCIDLTQTTVGNLYDDDFWTIWNGPAMKMWRQTVNHGPRGICSFGTCVFRRSAPVDKSQISRKLTHRMRHWVRSFRH
jgi:MoaA/NifB/PqqE/SkfB family radical SAM enzyme